MCDVVGGRFAERAGLYSCVEWGLAGRGGSLDAREQDFAEHWGLSYGRDGRIAEV